MERGGRQIAVLVLLVIYLASNVSSFSHKNIYPKPLNVNFGENVGEPLLLTPLIKAGKIREAQDLSRVTNLTDVISYSGFLTVNEKYDSNLYFWFFPAAVSQLCKTFSGKWPLFCMNLKLTDLYYVWA